MRFVYLPLVCFSIYQGIGLSNVPLSKDMKHKIDLAVGLLVLRLLSPFSW